MLQELALSKHHEHILHNFGLLTHAPNAHTQTFQGIRAFFLQNLVSHHLSHTCEAGVYDTNARGPTAWITKGSHISNFLFRQRLKTPFRQPTL